MIRALVFLCAMMATQASAACRQTLVLALDVSGSVDSAEYRLQIDGLANALNNPEVRAAIFAMPDAHVRLGLFEWSGEGSQRLLVPVTALTSPKVLSGIVAKLRNTRRLDMLPTTAIGEAMQMGTALTQDHAACWRRTLDISGDGKANVGPSPRDVNVPPWLTINGLVIATVGSPPQRDNMVAELSAFYHAHVIRGADAFVETAIGFEAFEAAMVRKLKRELQVQMVSGLPDQ